MHGSITEQTILDRMAAWGVPRRVAERPMREIVRHPRNDGRSENRLNWLLQKHRGKR